MSVRWMNVDKAENSLRLDQLILIKRFEMFANNISIIHKNISRLKNDVMRKYGLTGNQGIYLAYLLLYRDGLTVSQFAEIAGVDKAAVSRTYSVLYKKGYIDYPDFVGDKKYNTPAVITDKAREIMIPVVNMIYDLIDTISLTGIDEENRTIMYRTLRTTAGNISKLWSK